MNNERLQRWALIAEIVGGFAVLVTLILLVIEVSENTETLKANTYDSLVADLGEWRLGNARSEQFVALRGPFRELDSVDQERQRDTVISLFFVFERAFIQWKAGNLDEDAWERFRRSICAPIRNPNFETDIGFAIDRYTTQSFQNYRKSECVNDT